MEDCGRYLGPASPGLPSTLQRVSNILQANLTPANPLWSPFLLHRPLNSTGILSINSLCTHRGERAVPLPKADTSSSLPPTGSEIESCWVFWVFFVLRHGFVEPRLGDLERLFLLFTHPVSWDDRHVSPLPSPELLN